MTHSPPPFGRAALGGAAAGVVGGCAFALAMEVTGVPPALGVILVTGSKTASVAVHLVLSGLLGMAIGVILGPWRMDAGETVHLTVAGSVLWWYLGPLTLLPLLLGVAPAWQLEVMRDQLPGLFGHLVYGTVTGLVLAVLRRRGGDWSALPVGRLTVGAAAGVVGLAAIGGLSPLAQPAVAADGTTVGTTSASLTSLLVIGLVGGVGAVLLRARSPQRPGVLLLRGQVYGFLWWVAGELTLVPLVGGAGLAWTAETAGQRLGSLPVFLLLGALLVLGEQQLVRRRHDLAGETELSRSQRRLRVSDVLIGVVVAVGVTMAAAPPVGDDGLSRLVHILVGVELAALYGPLLRGRHQDAGAALGWGVCYGLLWWAAGPLVLGPLVLGRTPEWTPETASALFAVLLAHLVAGAGLGGAHWWRERRGFMDTREAPLEVRENGMPETGRAARHARRSSQAGAVVTASSVWVPTVIVVITIPVILATAL